MTRKMNQPATILKHAFADVFTKAEAAERYEWTEEQVNAYLEDFAQQYWHNAYVEVDYSKVTLNKWRKYAVKHEIEIEEDLE